MYRNLLVILVLVISLKDTNSARILGIIPTASYSHQVFFQQLWRQLALKGHDMVVITTDPTGETLPNFREVSLHQSYSQTKELMNKFVNASVVDFLIDASFWRKWADIADEQLSLPEVQEILRNKTEHFDLVMVEMQFPIFLAFKQRFNCPLIGVASLDGFALAHASMGNPVHEVLYPMPLFPRQSNLNFFERLASVVVQAGIQMSINSVVKEMEDVKRRHFGDDAPSFDDLMDSMDMLFINANPLFTPVRPLTPSTINLAGGLHMKPPQKLPKDLKDFLDSGKEGVVYFSLGSNVKSKDLTPELRKTLIETFKGLPCKVLWKFEDDQLPGKPDNVKIIKWAPQQDVLRHQNVKVFVTQGGIQSLEEALYTHVPLVTIPFFGDQQSNAEKVKDKGLGIVLDRYNLNTRELKDAIVEVMTSPIYKGNIVKLAGTIQDQPQTAMERAIWWTEYVLRHKGGRHLRGPKIPFYQYYYLDILAFLLAISVIILALFYALVKLLICVVKRLFTKKNKNIKKQKRN